MTNLARFEIEDGLGNISPSSDGGFDGEPGETIKFRLENTDAVVVRTTYEVFDDAEPKSPLATKDAPELDLVGATTGQAVDAASPSAPVTTTLADVVSSWKVRCKVNGGINPRTGLPDPNYVFARIVAVRTSSGLRKVIADERSEYSPRGHADAQNEMVDAIHGQTAPLRSGAFGSGVVAGVAATPGWQVLGAFVFDWTPGSTVQLDTIGLVSQGALTGRVRLYDLTAGAAVASSVLTFNATSETRVTSGNIVGDLVASHMYQIQAECTGGALVTDFASIRYAMLRGN